MFLSAREHASLRRCFTLLAEDDAGELELRLRLGRELLELLRADQFASYVWDAGAGRFEHRAMLHMSESNLDRYEAWYMFRDPITFELQSRRHATAVSEVLPHRALARTEFFVDFLARDGLHWGINLHAYDERDVALGDLRVWRAKHRRDFEPRDKALLDLIEPAFVAALRRARARRAAGGALADANAGGLLSPRELEVARCIGRGLTDKEIARELAIALPSVRTYLQRVFDKLGVHRRAAIAQRLRDTGLDRAPR